VRRFLTEFLLQNGVRNAEARNIIRDCFKKGQKCLFYMSGVKNPGVHGIVEITREAYEVRICYLYSPHGQPPFISIATLS
jgi:predicted RNA-binding protein with PUA-like domain